MKNYLFSLITIGFVLLMVGTVSADYVLQVEALTNGPLDSVTNYLGNKPAAPTTTADINRVYFPTSGTITGVEIYDYSGTAGTAEAYSYYIRKNNTEDFLVSTLSVSANERVFSNTTISVPVNAGDYFEIKRIHPNWATNPATNIVGGYVYINTTTPGYVLWGQALTNSPADNVINYIGGRPVAPSTAAQTNKIYVPSSGNITSAYITEYSGTAGTSETYGYSINRNGGMETVISNITAGTNLRLFNNSQVVPLNVNPGDFIEFKRLNSNWVTNPLTNIVGATAFVNQTNTGNIAGYPLWVQALTATPTDGATTYFGNRPIAASTTADTNKIYIRKNGTIKRAEIYYYSGTAGTSEPWSLYVRKNNTEDFLISTNNVSASERLFKNLNMNIPVVSGDYIEIKSVQPTWVTNPATAIAGGYVWLEYGTATECPVCPACDSCTNATSTGDGDEEAPNYLIIGATIGLICGTLIVRRNGER